MPKKNKTEGRPSPRPTVPPSNTNLERARLEIQGLIAREQGTAPPATDTARHVPLEIGPEEESMASSPPSTEKKASMQDFATLYGEGGGRSTDLATIERRDPNRKKKIIAWIITGLFVLLAASAGGFYLFVNRTEQFAGNQISFEVTKPSVVAAGGETQFTVRVNNGEAVDLDNAQLTIQYPEGFTFNSSTPTANNEAKNAWTLGTIKHGSSAEVTVRGSLLGDIGSVKELEAALSYVPANFNSEFQKKQSFSLTINDSILQLEMQMPIKVISGRSAQYKIAVVNNSSEEMQRIQLKLTVPSDLVVKNFKPTATSQGLWEFAALKSKASTEVTFDGVLTADEGAMREIKAEVGYVDYEGKYHLQNEETSVLFVVNPQLVLTLAINDSTTSGTASLGERLRYVLRYQNLSQINIKEMQLTATLTGNALDWKSLVDSHDGSVSGTTITWNKSQLPALGLVKAGDEGEISFSVALKDSLPGDKPSDVNYSVTSKAAASAANVPELEGGSLEVVSNELTMKINSNVDLRVEGRYYNDEYIPVGSGPLPPQVGSATRYQIYWYIKNNSNEVKNVQVSAVIPEGASWAADSAVSAGTVSYDQTTRQVTWTINKIPAHVGQSIPEIEVRFGIAITPTAAQVGLPVNLLGKSTITAEDTFTQQALTKERAAVTTELSSDPQAIGKGLVVSESPTNTNTLTNGQ